MLKIEGLDSRSMDMVYIFIGIKSMLSQFALLL